MIEFHLIISLLLFSVIPHRQLRIFVGKYGGGMVNISVVDAYLDVASAFEELEVAAALEVADPAQVGNISYYPLLFSNVA